MLRHVGRIFLTVLAMFWALNLGSFPVASLAMAPNSSLSSTSSFENAHTVLDSACALCCNSAEVLIGNGSHSDISPWSTYSAKHGLYRSMRCQHTKEVHHAQCNIVTPGPQLHHALCSA